MTPGRSEFKYLAGEKLVCMIPQMFMLLGFLFLSVGGLVVGLYTGRGEVLFVTSAIGIVLFMIGLIGYLKTRTTAYDMEPIK